MASKLNMLKLKGGISRYWRPTSTLLFQSKTKADKDLFGPVNILAKEIGLCPQATAREALRIGIELLAKEAGVDLGKALLADDGLNADQHGPTSYPQQQNSQDKSPIETRT